MLDEFSATIEKIYAAAADPSQWSDALTSVQELSCSAAVVVNLVDKDRLEDSQMLVTPSVHERVSDADLASYNENLLPYCPRIAAGIANPHADFVCDYMILSEAEMSRNVAYDWYSRRGFRYFIGSPVLETRRLQLMWSIQRSPRQGHVQRKDIELFQRLKPHIARALSLADELGTLRSFQRFSSAMLEALPQAVFALDASGRLLFANGSGAALLAQSDGLALVEGRLRTAQPAEQPSLDELIRSAVVPLGGRSSGWAPVSRPSGKLPYAVFIAPLTVLDDELTVAEAKVLVMVHDTGEHRSADPDMLTSLYGLTETEALLASALSAGHSIESAAALLHMRPSTARAHLKHVFAKVGVNRQQDLVRLLTSLSTISPPA